MVEFQMNLLIKILANRLFALLLLTGVGVWLLVIPAFTGSLGGNPLEKLLHQSGEIAIWSLGAVLALSPLRVLLPRAHSERLESPSSRDWCECVRLRLVAFWTSRPLRRWPGRFGTKFIQTIHLVWRGRLVDLSLSG